MSDNLADGSVDDGDREWRDEVKSWLVERQSVPDLERSCLHEGRPFGFQNRAWEELKGRMIEGDEIWSYVSPDETWEHLCGRAGYALVRDGQVIDDILTVMN